MATNLSAYTGCLLGLAVGDALGATVDSKTYQEICQDYGPAGLLGYDLVNGFASISSHTQVAAFCCNGLLVSTAKGNTEYLRFMTQALKEWARTLHLPGEPERRSCWLCKVPALRQRRSMDARTLDCFTRDVLGTPENPLNQGVGPGTLPAAIPVGLFFHPDRMNVQQVGQLGTQVVALTHGDPLAFLSGAVLAYTIAGIVQDEDTLLEQHFSHAAEAVRAQFGGEYPQAEQIHALIKKAIHLSCKPEIPRWQAMEELGCNTCPEVLAGAVYAVLADGGDFDSAMITAVNHSGKSAAVGAVAGAILGAKLGEEALPEFYLECLEPAAVLRELAADFYNGQPGQLRSRLFDDDWDRKYTQGLPVDREGWEEA